MSKMEPLRISPELIKRLDDHVDGIRYLDRNHMINVILLDWMDLQEEIHRGPHPWPGPRQPKRPARKKPAKKS